MKVELNNKVENIWVQEGTKREEGGSGIIWSQFREKPNPATWQSLVSFVMRWVRTCCSLNETLNFCYARGEKRSTFKLTLLRLKFRVCFSLKTNYCCSHGTRMKLWIIPFQLEGKPVLECRAFEHKLVLSSQLDTKQTREETKSE